MYGGNYGEVHRRTDVGDRRARRLEMSEDRIEAKKEAMDIDGGYECRKNISMENRQDGGS